MAWFEEMGGISISDAVVWDSPLASASYNGQVRLRVRVTDPTL